MISTSKFSDDCRKELLKLYKLSHDNETMTLIELMCKEPFNEGSFIEISQKMLLDYERIYLNIHPQNKEYTKLLQNFMKDARFVEFVRDVDFIHGIIGKIINHVKGASINVNTLILQTKGLVTHTNNVLKFYDLKKAILSDGTPVKNGSIKDGALNLFRRLFLVLGLMSSANLTNMGQKTVDASIPNQQAKEIQFDRAKKMEEAKIILIEAEKKVEEDKKNKFLEDYDLTVKIRSNVMTKAASILSKSKMPTDYVKPEHIMSLIFQESHFDPDAVSLEGAYGLMQIMSLSWPLKIPYDEFKGNIEKNIEAGLIILKQKEAYCVQNCPGWDKMSDDEKRDMLFAVYNCGEGKMNKVYHWNLALANSETKNQVDFIHNYQKYTYYHPGWKYTV